MDLIPKVRSLWEEVKVVYHPLAYSGAVIEMTSTPSIKHTYMGFGACQGLKRRKERIF